MNVIEKPIYVDGLFKRSEMPQMNYVGGWRANETKEQEEKMRVWNQQCWNQRVEKTKKIK